MSVCAFKRIWSLESWEKVLLQSIDGIELFLNFLLNALIVFLIIKTRQYRKQSFKLLLIVSISNCFTAVAGQCSFLLACFYKFGYLPCDIQRLLQGLVTWTCIICFLVNCLVGLDRYMHIRYPNTYNEKFSSKRFNIAMAMIFPVGIIELFLHYLSVNMRYRYPVFTIPFSLGVISITFGLQIKSVFMLKEHSRATEHLTASSKKITKLVMGYLLLFLTFMVGGKLFKAVCSFLPKGLIAKSTINFMVPLATLYTFLHYPAVAILFLATNTKSHQYLKKQFRWRKTSLNSSSDSAIRKRLRTVTVNVSDTRVPNVPNTCSLKLHVQ